MTRLNVGSALRAAGGVDPASIPDVVASAAGSFGAADVVLYLVDFAQRTLEPLPDRGVHAEVPHSEEVTATMAGRAFLERRATIAERPEGVRVWVPILEGSDRTGVLALTVPAATAAVIGDCEVLGLLAGFMIATQARTTDLYNVHRRRRALSLAASMQWDLLPPLVLKTRRLAVAGLLEPAYEVGGDCFDYALNDVFFDMAVIDAVGHGVESAVIAALTVGSYRHDRREGSTLEHMHASLDATLAAHSPELGFATGQLARVNLDTGSMTWTNAGHPLPLLIRGGRVVRELDCSPTLPWGLGMLQPRAPATLVATEALEPGDRVLFFTDGVVEARTPQGEPFGVERLADLAGQHASDQAEPEEILRHLIASVLDHQCDHLSDDATVILLQWNGPTPVAAKP